MGTSKKLAETTGGYVRITVLYFAIAALWSALHTIILPVRLLGIVDDAQKNTYLGLMSFTGLVLAALTQPVAGGLSDRLASRWGRMPLIATGVIIGALAVFGIGAFSTYALIFASYAITQIATNAAQGPYQAFIPEMVPPVRWGRAAGIKSVFEALGGVALLYPAAFLTDKYMSSGDSLYLYAALAILSFLLLAALGATVILVKEPGNIKNNSTASPRLNTSVLSKIDRRFGRFLISRTLFSLTFTTVQGFAFYFLKDVTDVSDPAQATAGLITMSAVGMAVCAYPAGWLSDRLGRRKVGFSAGLVGVASILLFLLFSKVFLLLMLASLLIGAAFGIYLSTNWALAADLAVKGNEAGYLALANAATAIGSALSRLIGPAIDFGNTLAADAGYTVMLVICLAAITTASVLLVEKR
jgi:Na+/melibiose symporter-like transporter